MYLFLQVGACVLAGAYLFLVTVQPRRKKWVTTIPKNGWSVAGWAALLFAFAFLIIGVITHAPVLTLAGIAMGASFALAVDNYWASENFQRKWGR